MYNDRRIARTRSCPTLFAVLKEEMVQGKKIRLSRGTLNYIKSKKAGNFTKSTSSSELETILEGDEGENCTDDDTLSSCSISSSHSEPGDMHSGNMSPSGTVTTSLENRIPNGLRISPRRLSQWSDSVVVQRYIPQGQNIKLGMRYGNDSLSQREQMSSLQRETSRHCPNNERSCLSHYYSNVSASREISNAPFLNNDTKARKDEILYEKQDMLCQKAKLEGSNESCRQNMNTTYSCQLWLPPVEWRVENMESLIWSNQHSFHKQDGGWWMERWTLYTENRQRLGDKFGIDADGTPWSEWWMEKELSESNVQKVGEKWGRNAKGERWYETWQVKSNGKVETTYRLERANSGTF